MFHTCFYDSQERNADRCDIPGRTVWLIVLPEQLNDMAECYSLLTKQFRTEPFQITAFRNGTQESWSRDKRNNRHRHLIERLPFSKEKLPWLQGNGIGQGAALGGKMINPVKVWI